LSAWLQAPRAPTSTPQHCLLPAGSTAATAIKKCISYRGSWRCGGWRRFRCEPPWTTRCSLLGARRSRGRPLSPLPLAPKLATCYLLLEPEPGAWAQRDARWRWRAEAAAVPCSLFVLQVLRTGGAAQSVRSPAVRRRLRSAVRGPPWWCILHPGTALPATSQGEPRRDLLVSYRRHCALQPGDSEHGGGPRSAVACAEGGARAVAQIGRSGRCG
jgi:hypothetical protein